MIAAITSCTNHRDPKRDDWRGLLARKAAAKGLTAKPSVEASLAPGSQVVAEYLEKAGLQKDLDKVGFNLVGFGCTTCIGNSGPLPPENSKAINDNDLVAAAVLSGNRNFEGRVNADVRANYLASPPLVVAYALAGIDECRCRRDHARRRSGVAQRRFCLQDIWPSNKEIGDFVAKNVTKQMFTKKYADVFKGDANWRKISVKGGMTYDWDKKSTYVQNPPYFVHMGRHPKPLEDVVDARVLALLLDFITTDHISPAGSIKEREPRRPLSARPPMVCAPADFNQYGARRGNHEVMVRGTFANVRVEEPDWRRASEGGVSAICPLEACACRCSTRRSSLREGIREWASSRDGRRFWCCLDAVPVERFRVRRTWWAWA